MEEGRTGKRKQGWREGGKKKRGKERVINGKKRRNKGERRRSGE